MFVVSKAKAKRNKFIVRTEVKKTQMVDLKPSIKPKPNNYFNSTLHQQQQQQQQHNPHQQQSNGDSNYINKDVHMNQPFINAAKQLIKKKIKFHFSVVRNVPQIKKHLKREKESKTRYRRINKDHNYASGRWKFEEHKRFVEAIIKHGNDWKEVQRCVKTRSCTQARSHAQKFFLKVRRAKLLKFNLDLSKTSIKMLHDFVSELPRDEYEKTLQALNNVAFERMDEKKSGSKGKSSTGVFDSSSQESDEMMSEMNNNDDNEYNLDKLMSLEYPSENPYSLSTKARTMSIDNEEQKQLQLPNRMNRESINSIEGFYQYPYMVKENGEPFSEKEYRKNFDNTFNMMPINRDCNNNFPILRSRKVSLEDDFQYNYIMKI